MTGLSTRVVFFFFVSILLFAGVAFGSGLRSATASPNDKSKGGQQWTTVATASDELKPVISFAQTALNPGIPTGQSMGTRVNVGNVLIARSLKVCSSSSATIFELVFSGTQAPICAANTMCPMYMMMITMHCTILKSSSGSYSLIESHNLEGGIGLNVNYTASLATNWVNIPSSATKTYSALAALYNSAMPSFATKSSNGRLLALPGGGYLVDFSLVGESAGLMCGHGPECIALNMLAFVTDAAASKSTSSYKSLVVTKNNKLSQPAKVLSSTSEKNNGKMIGWGGGSPSVCSTLPGKIQAYESSPLRFVERFLCGGPPIRRQAPPQTVVSASPDTSN